MLWHTRPSDECNQRRKKSRPNLNVNVILVKEQRCRLRYKHRKQTWKTQVNMYRLGLIFCCVRQKTKRCWSYWQSFSCVYRHYPLLSSGYRVNCVPETVLRVGDPSDQLRRKQACISGIHWPVRVRKTLK